jgi:Arm DNA-binding domain
MPPRANSRQVLVSSSLARRGNPLLKSAEVIKGFRERSRISANSFTLYVYLGASMPERKLLSAKYFQNVKPGFKPIETPDGGCPGLRLVVFSTGRKSWIMRFRRPDGRHAKLTLGPVDFGPGVAMPKIGGPLTLAAARRIAGDVVTQRLVGIDPAAKKIEAQRERVENSFGVLAKLFIERHAKPRRLKVFDDLLGEFIRLGKVVEVSEALIPEPEYIKARFVRAP